MKQILFSYSNNFNFIFAIKEVKKMYIFDSEDLNVFFFLFCFGKQNHRKEMPTEKKMKKRIVA